MNKCVSIVLWNIGKIVKRKNKTIFYDSVRVDYLFQILKDVAAQYLLKAYKPHFIMKFIFCRNIFRNVLISVALKIKLSEILPLFKDSSNCEVFLNLREKSIQNKLLL